MENIEDQRRRFMNAVLPNTKTESYHDENKKKIVKTENSFWENINKIDTIVLDRAILLFCVIILSIVQIRSSYIISGGNRYQKMENGIYLDKRTNNVYWILPNEAKFLYKMPE
jgi:hypothetical protein